VVGTWIPSKKRLVKLSRIQMNPFRKSKPEPITTVFKPNRPKYKTGETRAKVLRKDSKTFGEYQGKRKK